MRERGVWPSADTSRVIDLRWRVRAAMEQPPVIWDCPREIDTRYIDEPLAVRKARALALKLARMPTDLWDGQLFAGSLTLENSRLHAERGFPQYATETEEAEAAARGLSVNSVFGHIAPDYARLLTRGLSGVRAEAVAGRADAHDTTELAFLDSVIVAVDGVMTYAARLAARCEANAAATDDVTRATELQQMAANLQQVPSGPAQTFWQALQAVWLLHMVFHATINGNAVGRLDQIA